MTTSATAIITDESSGGIDAPAIALDYVPQQFDVRLARGKIDASCSASPSATLESPSWRIVPLADGPPSALDPGIKIWSEHLAALSSLNRTAATWQIVPAHELTD